MPEEITLTINLKTAQALTLFLAYHGYEWRHTYDDQQRIRDSYWRTVPSAESRTAWLDLLTALEQKQTPSIPITY